MCLKTIENKMNLALKQAKIAYDLGEVPVGCIIFDKDNNIVSTGYNLVKTRKNPLYHAEIISIKKACSLLQDPFLTDCTIFVTVEPCAMCAGAIKNTKIRKLYFGAYEQKTGAVGSTVDLLRDKTTGIANGQIEVYSGILEKECAHIMQRFFSKLRK